MAETSTALGGKQVEAERCALFNQSQVKPTHQRAHCDIF